MPADYDAIRAGNIARYGTDTAVLALLGQLYSDRAQFLYELIQNAEDAGATWLGFDLSADRLEVRHDGRPFTESDVRAICAVGSSTKPGDLTAIGRFGIGFKAVYAYTSTPRIHSPAARTDPAGPASDLAGSSAATALTSLDNASGHAGPDSPAGRAGSAETGEHFRIEHYVRPAGIPAEGQAGETLFVFPFDRADVPAATAVGEVSAGLTKLPSRALLFLRSIGRITISGLAGPVTLERVTEILGPDRRRIRLRRAGRAGGSGGRAGRPAERAAGRGPRTGWCGSGMCGCRCRVQLGRMPGQLAPGWLVRRRSGSGWRSPCRCATGLTGCGRPCWPRRRSWRSSRRRRRAFSGS